MKNGYQKKEKSDAKIKIISQTKMNLLSNSNISNFIDLAY